MATLYDTNKCLSMVLKEKANICSQLATVHAYVPSTLSYCIFGFKSAVRKHGFARKQQIPAPYKNLNTLAI